MGGNIPKSFSSGYLSDEERRKREQGQRQQNQATNFANSTTTKAPYGSSQALAWQQPQSNFVPNQQQAANDPWSQSGALEKQRQQQQQEAERLQKQVLQNSQQSQQMAAEEVPEFKTTSEAVGYFYDKQHPYGGYTKMTGPLGDISYYDENLNKPKEPQPAPNMGFARTSATQPMAFANQAFGREPTEDEKGWKNLNFRDRVISAVDWLPEYQALEDARKEMQQMNYRGADNYAHRLAMCRAGQMTSPLWPYSPAIGMGLGILKEMDDLYKKSLKGNMPWQESLADSWKDMKNNFEGLCQGVNHPNDGCREWLNDLDYQNNVWRK